MAQIYRFEESKRALAEIELMIKEIKLINDFLQMKNPSGIYEISFKQEHTEGDVEERNADAALESEMTDNSDNKGKRKMKKGKKSDTFSAPFLCEDPKVVRTYVLCFKKTKVKKVRELSKEFNIFLDEKDESILNMYEEEIGNE